MSALSKVLNLYTQVASLFSGRPSGHKLPIRKWYLATNVHGLQTAYDQIQAAVISAAMNTKLVAHLIYDDEGEDDTCRQRIGWLERNGVQIIRHRSTLLPPLTAAFGERMKIYSGHWLRCDIPLLEKDDPYVLYTDIDVIFLKDLPAIDHLPEFIACGPEHSQNDYSYFNSGVMIINIQAFRSCIDRLTSTVERRLDTAEAYDDQGMLNELFSNAWTHLSPEWNWKPYWGRNDAAAILHFHGPKPANAAEMLAGNTGIFGPDFQTIFLRNPEGYRYYLGIFSDHSETVRP